MIFTPLSSPIVRCINPKSFQQIELLTDHFIIEFYINLNFKKIKRKRITYRDLKSIDLPRFVIWPYFSSNKPNIIIIIKTNKMFTN